MTTPAPIRVAGIDVGKTKLDAHIAEGSLQRQFNNDNCGRRALRNWLLKHGVSRAVFEPTVRYHRNLHQGLTDAGLETVLINPLRSRRFAEAIGQCAKNDRVDAAMLARFGLLNGLEPTPPRPHNLHLLSDLLVLRRNLVERLGTLLKLCAELDPEAARCLSTTLGAPHADIEACDRRMRAHIAADAELCRRDAIIQSIPGCGPVNAACLCAAMPELSRLGRRTRSLLSLSCVGSLAYSTPSFGKTASGRPSPRPGICRLPRETAADKPPTTGRNRANDAPQSPLFTTFP